MGSDLTCLAPVSFSHRHVCNPHVARKVSSKHPLDQENNQQDRKSDRRDLDQITLVTIQRINAVPHLHLPATDCILSCVECGFPNIISDLIAGFSINIQNSENECQYAKIINPKLAS
jgi:hypothetical protein